MREFDFNDNALLDLTQRRSMSIKLLIWLQDTNNWYSQRKINNKTAVQLLKFEMNWCMANLIKLASIN